MKNNNYLIRKLDSYKMKLQNEIKKLKADVFKYFQNVEVDDKVVLLGN